VKGACLPLIPPALFSCCPSSPRPPFNPHGEKGKGGVRMRAGGARTGGGVSPARVSVCIRPAHAEARRRGDGERGSYKDRWMGLHPSPDAGALCDTADPDDGQRI
jgi:hypothetical protein